MNKILHKELSYEIAGLCFKVQKKLGRFCREVQYSDEFEKMLLESKIKYKCEYRLDNFKSDSPKGNRVDFLIEDKIIIDFKAKKFITKEDYNQMQRYLQSANLELGMIINFRNIYLKPKRILNSRYSDPNYPNRYPNDPNVDNSDNSDENSGHSDHPKGFTLVETLIYIAIIGGVIVAFVSFALSISDSRNKTYVIQEVQANARLALGVITQKIQASNGLNASSSIFGVDPGVLSLSMASSSLNPTLISLSADDGILQITEGVNMPVFLTSDEIRITNLVFINLTASSTRENVKIDLTASFASSSSVIFQGEQSLQTSVSWRQ